MVSIDIKDVWKAITSPWRIEHRMTALESRVETLETNHIAHLDANVEKIMNHLGIDPVEELDESRE